MPAIDFDVRDWVAHSGWPIGRDEVAPYYDRAARFMGIDEFRSDAALFRALKVSPPPFLPEKIYFHLTKYGATPSLRELYRHRLNLASDLHLILHANVTQIRLNENLCSVTELVARSLEGAEARIHAKRFVLATGGIEAPRLLLASNQQIPVGIGNNYDRVGRYFMDHLSAPIGNLHTDTPAIVQHFFNLFHHGGRKYAVRLTTSPLLQTQKKLLNATTGVRFVPPADSCYESLRLAYHQLRSHSVDTILLQRLAKSIADVGTFVPVVWHRFVNRRTYTPGAMFQIGLMCEQEPDPESRITLSDTCDVLGQPYARIRWRVSDLAYHTMVTFGRVLRDELSRLKLGTVCLEDWLDPSCGASYWRTKIADSAHHMGATRMSDSPKDGVVTHEGRVHGIDNLYIASTSVFPTGSHSNPTFTLLALTFRLADRLKRQLR